jgi:hypothetical protein
MMALTESRLRQIIREEAKRMMAEGPSWRDSERDRYTMWDRNPGRHDPYNEYPKGGEDEYDPDEEDFPEEEEEDDF